MKKSIIKRILGVLTLIICLCTVFMLLNSWFGHWNDHNYFRMDAFKNEPENTLDIIFIGSSDLSTGFSSALAYKQFGFTSYPYVCDCAPASFWKTMVGNVLQTQQPDLFVVDIHGVLYTDEEIQDCAWTNHLLFDSMPLNERKIKEMSYVHNHEKYDYIEYFFPYLLYCSSDASLLNINYVKDTYYNKSGNSSRLKGAVACSSIFPKENVIADLQGDESEHELGSLAKQYLIDFLEYGKEQNLPILFVYCPNVPYAGKYSQELLPAECAETIIREYGYEFINFQYLVKEIGLDYCTDFYNYGHMNVYGQRKFTQYFGKYLTDRYSFSHSGKLSEEEKKIWVQAGTDYDTYYQMCEEATEKGEELWLYDSTENYEKMDSFSRSMMIVGEEKE